MGTEVELAMSSDGHRGRVRVRAVSAMGSIRSHVSYGLHMAHVSYVQTESIAIGNIASSHVYVTNFKFYNLGA